MDEEKQYYDSLILQEYPEHEALQYTQQHYPNFGNKDTVNEQILVGSPTIAQPTTLIMVQPAKFSPSPNYRNISVIVLISGISLGVIGALAELPLLSLGCWGLFVVAAVLDCIYYYTRYVWERSRGESETYSIIGMVGDAFVVGIIAAFLFSIIIFSFLATM